MRAAGDLAGADVVEIGPGPGGLTRSLLASNCRKVYAVEKDERCLDALAEIGAAHPGRLEVINEDALALESWRLGQTPRHIVANLPYNVGSLLLVRWMTALAADPTCLNSLTLMFQKEVAQRLTSWPRAEHYGRLTILTQWLCEVQSCFDVAPSAFVPPPKVVSTVVRLLPRAAPKAPARLAFLERVTAAAFGQRRKMLRQSLKSVGGEALLAAAALEGTRRAEELTVEDFCALARALEAKEA